MTLDLHAPSQDIWGTTIPTWTPIFSFLHNFSANWHFYTETVKRGKKTEADIAKIKVRSNTIAQQIGDWLAKSAPTTVTHDVETLRDKMRFIATTDNAELIEQIGSEADTLTRRVLETVAKELVQSLVRMKLNGPKTTQCNFEPVVISGPFVYVEVRGSVVVSSNVRYYFKVKIDSTGSIASNLTFTD
jgi:hypothetical protein